VCYNSYYPLQRVRELITDYDNNFSTPSIMSVKKARQTYARQGGTSSIFVHDDELQLIPDSESDREERVKVLRRSRYWSGCVAETRRF
jgi:hypothetical protein